MTCDCPSRFLEAPKSRRELLARERAEEERVENEMVRLAAESQMERNQRQIKQGREEMKRYQSENEASDNGGEDNENDSDEEGGGDRPKSSCSSANRKSKRQNRSVFTKSCASRSTTSDSQPPCAGCRSAPSLSSRTS